MIDLPEGVDGQPITTTMWNRLVRAIRQALNISVCPPLTMIQGPYGTIIGLSQYRLAVLNWQATNANAGQVATTGPDIDQATIPVDTLDSGVTSGYAAATPTVANLGTLSGGVLTVSVVRSFMVSYKVIVTNAGGGTAGDTVIQMQRSTDGGSTWTNPYQATSQGTPANGGSNADQSFTWTGLVKTAASDKWRLRMIDQGGSDQSGWDGSNSSGQGATWTWTSAD